MNELEYGFCQKGTWKRANIMQVIIIMDNLKPSLYFNNGI